MYPIISLLSTKALSNPYRLSEILMLYSLSPLRVNISDIIHFNSGSNHFLGNQKVTGLLSYIKHIPEHSPEMAKTSCHNEYVPKFMKTEDPRNNVRPLQGIDDCANAVTETAGC